MAIYLGLDQSLNNTGIAITNGSKTAITVFRSRAKDSELQKLVELERVFTELLTAYEPTRVYLEEVYTVRFRIRSSLSLIRVETCLRLTCERLGVPHRSFSASPRHPESWPKAIGAKSTKIATAELFLPLINDATTTDHETDALGILYAGVITDTKKTKAGMMKTPIKRVNARAFRKDARVLHSFL